MNDLDIMALTVWAEARGEPVDGQRAVAWVLRNRAAKPGWWRPPPLEALPPAPIPPRFMFPIGSRKTP